MIKFKYDEMVYILQNAALCMQACTANVGFFGGYYYGTSNVFAYNLSLSFVRRHDL